MQYDVQCTIKQKIRPGMLDCAHIHPALAHTVYSSTCVGSTSYFVVYADVASQAEIRQGRELEQGWINGTIVVDMEIRSHV